MRQMLRALQLICLLAYVPATKAETETTRAVPTAPSDYLTRTNPLEKDPSALQRGQSLFERKCAKCHGKTGLGDGDAGKGLQPPPVAFAKPGYLAKRPPGQLFWIIEKGSPRTDMEAWGPGSENNMKPEDIWSLVAFLKATFTK